MERDKGGNHEGVFLTGITGRLDRQTKEPEWMAGALLREKWMSRSRRVTGNVNIRRRDRRRAL